MHPEEEAVQGVRRKMELQRRNELRQSVSSSGPPSPDWDQSVVVRVRADLFINARSWERVKGALSLPGPLRLYCRYLRVEELPAPSVASLLELLPRDGLLGLDIRYSSLGVSGLALLLPLLEPFPLLHTLRLHYCNLDLQRAPPGQQGALQDMCSGLGVLKKLRRLSLTALRLPGHLRLLLRYEHKHPLQARSLGPRSCGIQLESEIQPRGTRPSDILSLSSPQTSTNVWTGLNSTPIVDRCFSSILWYELELHF